MPRLGMCLNDLNYLQSKTSRLYHIRRTYTKCKCQNKNVLEQLVSLRGSKSEIYFEDFKTSRKFLFLHFTFRIRASNVVKA